MLIIFGLIFTLIFLTFSNVDCFEFNQFINKNCSLLGYPKAVINECGYCVGEETGLDFNFGKDCKGICNGETKLDCRQICDGHYFKDECTNQCTNVKEMNWNFRDCRGECVHPELENAAYSNDECQICSLSNRKKSPFLDCNNQCTLPGSSIACEQPFISHVELISEINCTRDNQKNVTACKCQDLNDCYKIDGLDKKFVVKGVKSMVSLFGYFHPPLNGIYCLFKHEISNEIISSQVNFKNKSAIQCAIMPLLEGRYSIGLRFDFLYQDVFEDEPCEIQSYDLNKALLTSMSPTKILSNELFSFQNVFFSGPNTSQVPNLTLTCQIKIPNQEFEITTIGDKPFSCPLPPEINEHWFSMEIIPTVEGTRLSFQSFKLSIISFSPFVSYSNCFISSDGLTIVIMFTKPINLKLFDSKPNLCEYILTRKTFLKLKNYQDLKCVWSSKIQFLIYTKKPILTKNFQVSLKLGLFQVENKTELINQEEIKIDLKKLSTEWWSHTPQLMIVGPNQVPKCGLFSLSGHYTSPKGTSYVRFNWSISKDEQEPINTQFFFNQNRQNIVLNSEIFEYGHVYLFTLEAFSKNDQVMRAFHRLIKLEYDAPIGNIYSNTMFVPTSFPVNLKLSLWSEIFIPSCVNHFKKINLFWNTSSPKVRFNFELKHSSIFTLSSFSLPSNVKINFSLTTFFGNHAKNSSVAIYSIIGQEPLLKALIANGSPMITFGTKSGLFTLSSYNSEDGSHSKLNYHWNCIDSDTSQPCYINALSLSQKDQFNQNYLLINSSIQKLPNLTFDSNFFPKNRELIFSLRVIDPNNIERISDIEMTLIKTLDNNAPQVFIGSIYINGKYRVQLQSLQSLAKIVPAYTPLTLRAMVIGEVKTIEWVGSNHIHQLNWNNRKLNKNEIETELYLHSDYIHPYGFYVYKLKACNFDDHCSEASTQFIVSKHVTECQILASSYKEYELMNISIERCNLPSGYGPLIYQLYASNADHDLLFPISTSQFSKVFITFGLPLINGPENTFAVKICDNFDFCNVIFSNPFKVDQNLKRSTLIEKLLYLARHHLIAGDSFYALSLVNLIIRDKQLDKKYLALAIKTGLEISVQLLSTPSQLISKQEIALFYSFHAKLVNFGYDQKSLNLISQITQKAFALDTLPDLVTLKSTLNQIISEFIIKRKFSKKSKQVLKSARQTCHLLVQAIAAQLPLGKTFQIENSDLLQGETNFGFKMFITHEKKIRGIDLKLGKFNISVKISPSFFKQIHKSLKCSTQADHKCNSIVYAFTIFSSSGLFPTKKSGFHLTPTFDLSLFSPGSGAPKTIKPATNLIKFISNYKTSETFKNGYIGCYFWNKEKQSWQAAKTACFEIFSNQAVCWSDSLSPITIIQVPYDINFELLLLSTFILIVIILLISYISMICCFK